MKSCFITSPPPGNGYLCMFISKRFSLAKCNVKNGRLAKKPLDPKIRKWGMAAASGHILPLENSSIHQWCFTGTWTLPPCRIPACLGLGRWLDPYRDQGGTATNYADHVHGKIAADNYISKQQTGEQSIVLAMEQRWPLQSASLSQTLPQRTIQFAPAVVGDAAVAVGITQQIITIPWKKMK